MTAVNVPSTQSSDSTQQAHGESGPNHHDEQTGAKEVNVPAAERWGSALGGGALVLTGLKMRSLPGAALAIVGAAMIQRGATGHCMGYAALGINRARGDGAQPEEYSERGIHVVETMTIDKSPEELYRFWRDFKNLPKVMHYLESVETINDKKSRWTAKAPAGMTVQWEAEIINDVPNETIAWRSLHPATVDNAGSVRFVPGPANRGTEVTVTLDYILPAGRVGWAFAKLFGKDPAAEVREDLRRLKSEMEVGETPTIQGQPHGRRGMIGSMMATD